MFCLLGLFDFISVSSPLSVHSDVYHERLRTDRPIRPVSKRERSNQNATKFICPQVVYRSDSLFKRYLIFEEKLGKT